MAVIDNVFLSTSRAEKGKLRLVAIDHTHCFADCQPGQPFDLNRIAIPGDLSVYGRFSEFQGFLDRATVRETAAKLGTIDHATVAAIVESIPDEWHIGRTIRSRWIKQILQRAEWTASEIENQLLGPKDEQGDFEFGNAEDNT